MNGFRTPIRSETPKAAVSDLRITVGKLFPHHWDWGAPRHQASTAGITSPRTSVGRGWMPSRQ